MRCLLIFLVAAAVAAFSACSHEKVDPADMAGRTARLYYEYLLQGNYDAYVDGFWQPDSIPSSYREQLVTNARMFIGQQNKEHGGIAGVKVVSVNADTARHMANAFLLFSYGDSTSEQVVVPMVERRGVWMMK